MLADGSGTAGWHKPGDAHWSRSAIENRRHLEHGTSERASAFVFVVGICLSFVPSIAGAHAPGGIGCTTTRPSWPGSDGQWYSCKTPTTRPDRADWPDRFKWHYDLTAPGDCSGAQPTTRPACGDSDDSGDSPWNDPNWWKSPGKQDCSNSGDSQSSSDGQTDPNGQDCGTWPQNNDSSSSCSTSGDSTSDDTSSNCGNPSDCNSSGDDSSTSDKFSSSWCMTGSSGSTDPAAVPEPASAGLVAVIGSAMLARRRQRRG